MSREIKCSCGLIGTVLYGYCNGFFGRDSYGDKVIEAVGKDWIVVRTEQNEVDFCSFSDFEAMLSAVKEWSNKEK
jgi:hypothetical protein